MKHNPFEILNNCSSAGICDNCTIPKMENQGNGVTEPLDPILFCKKVGIQIEPLPPDEQVKFCIFYQPFKTLENDPT